MARFFTLSTDVSPKPYRTVQSPGIIKVGATSNNDPTAMAGTLNPVGLTDTDMELNPNLETSPVTSAQMFNPYNLVETGWAWQVTASLDQIDVWNMALAFSYDLSETVTASSLLTLDGQNPSPFRSVRLQMEAPTNAAAATAVAYNIDFYKAKVVSNGGMPISPESKSTLPVMIHGLGNSNDEVGIIHSTEQITDPSFE